MTHEQRQKIYTALAAPFPQEAVERTDGRVTGRGYDTTGIKYQYVVNRLNEAVGLGNWRAHRAVTVREIVTARGRPAFEAICDITLELGEWRDGEFAVFAEALADGGHAAGSEADARKGAYTNAFKKAAAFFGCGRQAYEGSIDDDNLPADTDSDAQPQAAAAATASAHSPPVRPDRQDRPEPGAKLVATSRNRLTSKQLSAIWGIGRKIGYEQAALRAYIKQVYGVQPEFLSRDQASQIIGSMATRAGAGQAGPGGEEHREPVQEG